MNFPKSIFKYFQNASLKKKIIIVIVVVILIFVISKFILPQNKQSQISTDTVKKTTIVDTVSESGNIQANQVNIIRVPTG